MKSLRNLGIGLMLLVTGTLIWAASNHVIKSKTGIEIRPGSSSSTQAYGEFVLEGGSLTLLDLIATPSNPSPGYFKFYPKDGLFFKLDSAGNEVPVGTGGSSLDEFYQETFEINDLSLWTTGNSATPFSSGTIAGTAVISTASPIAGDNTYFYTQAGAGSASDWSAAPVITLERKQKGAWITLSGTYEYDGADDDMTLYAYTDLSTTVPIAELQLDTATNSTRFQMTGYVPANATSLQFGHFTSVFNANKKLKLDDLDWATNKFPEINTSVDTEWRSYTPTITGLGTVTGLFIEYRRDGSDLLLRGQFNSGTATATSATISLPQNLTIKNSLLPDANSRYRFGDYNRVYSSVLSNSDHAWGVITNNGQQYDKVLLASRSTSATQYQNDNATTIFGNNELIVLGTIRIPIEGWSVTQPTVLSPTDNVAFVRYNENIVQSIPNNAYTIVRYDDKVEDNDGLVTAGASWKFTSPVNGVYSICASDRLGDSTAEFNASLAVYKDNVFHTVLDAITTKYLDADSNQISLAGCTALRIEKSSYVDIRIFQNSGAALSTKDDSQFRWVTISRMDKSALASSPTKNPRCALTVTGDNSFSQVFGYIEPYQTREGQWKAHINAGGTNSSTSLISLTFAGIVFKTGLDQALGGVGGGPIAVGCALNGGASTGACASAGTTAYRVNGTVELNGKPNISGCDL